MIDMFTQWKADCRQAVMYYADKDRYCRRMEHNGQHWEFRTSRDNSVPNIFNLTQSRKYAYSCIEMERAFPTLNEFSVKYLYYYADPVRYRSWNNGRHTGDFLLFDASSWGSAPFHMEPPKNADEEPWALAQEGLRALDALEFVFDESARKADDYVG